MTTVEVHDVSRIVSKDSAKTGTMFLCNIDQRLGYYVRNLFFYDDELDVEHLKSSLAEVLDSYHYWTGRLRFNDSGRMEIDCNNKGVFFAVASSSLSKEEVTSDNFDDFFFLENEKVTTLEELPLLTIQVTRLLGDKSWAISMLDHHTLADATSGMTFLLNFASISRGLGLYLVPDSDRTRLRARDPPRVSFEHGEFVKQGDNLNNRFTLTPQSVLQAETRRKMAGTARTPRKTISFSSSKLGEIKLAALKDGALRSCSTFEALAAVIWRAHAASLPGKSSSDVMRLRFMVDSRNIVDPPLGHNFCGNAAYGAFAEMTLAELQELPLSAIVGRVQEARKRVSDEYVRSGWDYLELNRDAWYRHDCDTMINAWPRVMKKALELDFGSGKPSRVEFPLDPRNPSIVFFPLTNDGSIVVSVSGDAGFATFKAKLECF